MAEMIEATQSDKTYKLKCLQKTIGNDMTNFGCISAEVQEFLESNLEESIQLMRVLSVYNMTVHWRQTEPSKSVIAMIDFIRKHDPMLATDLIEYPVHLKESLEGGADGSDLQNLACDYAQVEFDVLFSLRQINELQQVTTLKERKKFYKGLFVDLNTWLDEIQDKELPADCNERTRMMALVECFKEMEDSPFGDKIKVLVEKIEAVLDK